MDGENSDIERVGTERGGKHCCGVRIEGTTDTAGLTREHPAKSARVPNLSVMFSVLFENSLQV